MIENRSPNREELLDCRVSHSSRKHTAIVVPLRLALLLLIGVVAEVRAQTPSEPPPAPLRAMAGCSVHPSADKDRICLGDSVQLRADGTGNFSWTPATGLSCATCADPMAHPTMTTTYVVTATSDDGCVARDSILVVVNALPWAFAGNDMTICAGDSVSLDAYGGITFQWEPTDGLSCTDCPAPWAKPAQTTRYILTTENIHGCLAYDTVLITVVAEPIADAGPGGTICLGGSLQLHASGGNRYAWTPSTGLSCTDCPEPVATPTTTTTYYVTASSGTSARCVAVDSVTVVVLPKLIPQVSPAPKICSGDSALISASGGETYHWEPAEGLSCTDCASPFAHPTTTTTYYVTISSGPCSALDSVTVMVVPYIDLHTLPVAKICPGDSVQLTVSGGGNYHWEPAEGLSCVDCGNPVAHPSHSTTYYVSAANANGCTGLDSVTVIVDSSGIVAPSHIGRGYRVKPGGQILVPVELDTAIDAAIVDRITIHVGLDERTFSLAGLALDGTLLEGWGIDSARDAGGFTVTFTAPAGEHLKGKGALVNLVVGGYIGPNDSSEIRFDVLLPGRRCPTVTSVPGLVTLDSICGLGLRLIEVTGSKFAIADPRPNPASGSATIEFSIGLEGPALLQVQDDRGRKVATLVNAPLSAGRYSVVWETSGIPSGIYFCTLTSAGWTGRTRLLLAR